MTNLYNIWQNYMQNYVLKLCNDDVQHHLCHVKWLNLADRVGSEAPEKLYPPVQCPRLGLNAALSQCLSRRTNVVLFLVAGSATYCSEITSGRRAVFLKCPLIRGIRRTPRFPYTKR